MKTVIAGSRSISCLSEVEDAIFASGFEITEVVSGGAKGVDTLGEIWAKRNGVPVKVFLAKWDDIKAPGAIVKQGRYGAYNARAGLDRNIEMAEYSDALIAIWDGVSTGTRHMIQEAEKRGLKVYIHRVS